MRKRQFDGGIARIEDVEGYGMVSLRVSAETALRRARPQRGQACWEGETTTLWMSPDELLFLCPRAEVAGLLRDLAQDLAGVHHLAADVSSARALFDVRGRNALEVMAKLMPIDLSPQKFSPGRVRRSRIGQVAAAIWMQQDGALRVICFRSVADYVWDLMVDAARPGTEVGAF
ncbi:sarcosine oxidase subunit gamma [Poseidonocella pacifica]|uniref:Sarcosine oxidase subunit gamma n=1 Tax=Poseidonocella pacifica TaxID=871651 RepID=A0A1I0V101_9RHOB|nr:sarcosine oxidase subunit gamma family protein [Poseidonocella pacifica]SFA69995.1 sarcosine oxidase subunit gamma [Poseidonocella pacifica]